MRFHERFVRDENALLIRTGPRSADLPSSFRLREPERLCTRLAALMYRRIQLSLVLFAWLLATGSQWHVVQTFAWSRMVAAYAKTMPLREAVRLTFTPDNMCGVCELVSAAQQQTPENSALPVGTSLDTKAPLVFQPVTAFVITCETGDARITTDTEHPAAQRAAPPVPPPRTVAV